MKNTEKADTPEIGVLRAVGYKVCKDGVRQKHRRQILDYVMSETLPAVGSPAYIAEWGEPKTRVRYRKLHRIIRIFATSERTLDNMDKAVMAWEDDLEYLEKTWSHLKINI